MRIDKSLFRSQSRREFLKIGFRLGMGAGLGGGLWLAGCKSGRGIKKPNIILITLDTTRADRLSCYGYSRRTSPNLDTLARESLLYTRATASSNWTLPSHASLFTGKFTSSHGARYDPEGPLHLADALSGPWSDYRVRGLARNELTLAELLKDAGYATGAVVGGPWLKKPFGLNKGFDDYDDEEISSLNGRTARQITARAMDWIEQPRSDNFFLFLNYFDPHEPYGAPEGYEKAFFPKNMTLSEQNPTTEELRALYDGEILYMDHYIGRLLQKVKDLGLYDNTWIIVTADHGELLGEHGEFSHGDYLYRELLHVPLFMKYPAGEMPAGRTDVRVQLTDIFAIICKRVGVPLPQGIQGGLPPQIGHPVIAETYPLRFSAKNGNWRAIFEDDYKFIWNSKGNHQLFNLREDPRENVNLANRDRQTSERMAAKLDQYLKSLPKPGRAGLTQELDDETKKALKSLGYLE